MFTGLVEEVGKVTEVRKVGVTTRLTVQGNRVAADAQVNDSISVSGVCLTVTAKYGLRMAFDVVTETLQRTTLRYARPGASVNLERALAVGGRIGGHFVLGHVDGTGRITNVLDRGTEKVVTIKPDADLMPLMVAKGSVAVDGVSLTIASVDADTFTVALIPQTIRITTFREARVGDMVNIEADILGKYVERLLTFYQQSGGVTAEKLVEAGFGVVGGEALA